MHGLHDGTLTSIICFGRNACHGSGCNVSGRLRLLLLDHLTAGEKVRYLVISDVVKRVCIGYVSGRVASSVGARATGILRCRVLSSFCCLSLSKPLHRELLVASNALLLLLGQLHGTSSNGLRDPDMGSACS